MTENLDQMVCESSFLLIICGGFNYKLIDNHKLTKQVTLLVTLP